MPHTPDRSSRCTGEFARNHASSSCGLRPQNSPLVRSMSRSMPPLIRPGYGHVLEPECNEMTGRVRLDVESLDHGAIATITNDNPEKHNAFDDDMDAELFEILGRLR